MLEARRSATFSLVAVLSRDKVSVTANGQKLKIVDANAAIQRHACTGCECAYTGRIENKAHPFYGFRLHAAPGVAGDQRLGSSEFAAFVSSIIKDPARRPDAMAGVRARLEELKLEPYRLFNRLRSWISIATHTAKAKGTLAALGVGCLTLV